jgi:hypothetical protein
MNLVRSVPLIAMLLMTASPVVSATPYELAHAAQLLKQEFSDGYFASGDGGRETSVALRKSLIHVLALTLTANSACGLGLDADRLTTSATWLSGVEPMAPDFFSNIRETVAAMTGRELKNDQAGTCQHISTLYKQSEPWIELELAQVATRGHPSDHGLRAAAQAADEAQIVPIDASKPAIDAAADVAIVPIAFSDASVRVPIKIDPSMPGKPLIDLERMITDQSFAGQTFPDYICPPQSSALACKTMFEGNAKLLKSNVMGDYQPSEFLCQDTRTQAAIKGTGNYATALQMAMLQATLTASGVELSEDKLSFNPGGYYLYRLLMASEVCLGLRQ